MSFNESDVRRAALVTTGERGEFFGDGESVAIDMLSAAADHMIARASTYDSPEGERSMGRTVAAFNAITGNSMRESEGWLFMALLKMVRSEQRPIPHKDSLEDLVAYSALYGEARMGGVGK